MVKVRYVQDDELVASLKQSVADNDGYCPCRLSKTDDTKCMCKEFRDIIKSDKIEVCHCGLYETYNA